MKIVHQLQEYKDGELVSFTYFKPLNEISTLSSNVDETIELDKEGIVKNKGVKVYKKWGDKN